jgi:hypothetical protein
LDQDEICCAQVRYTWKCKQCHKLTTGFAMPYGKCFLCGGDLAVVEAANWATRCACTPSATPCSSS